MNTTEISSPLTVRTKINTNSNRDRHPVSTGSPNANLGSPLSVHPFGPAVLRLVQFFLVGLGLLAIYGLWILYPHIEEDRAALGPYQVIALITVVIWLLAAWSIYARRRGRNDQIIVYADYLVKRRANRTQAIAWRDVRRIWRDEIHSGRSQSHRYEMPSIRLESSDGQSMKIGNALGRSIGNVLQLAKAIETNTTPTIAENYLKMIQSGRTVAFGPFQINRQGIVAKQKLHRWNEIEGLAKFVSICNGQGLARVGIKKRGSNRGIHYVVMGKIENYPAFAVLVGYFVGREQQPS